MQIEADAVGRASRRLDGNLTFALQNGFQPLVNQELTIATFGSLTGQLHRFTFLGDAAKVGVYAVAFRLVEATRFLGTALAAAMLPWLARAELGGGVGLAKGYALGLKAINALLLPAPPS